MITLSYVGFYENRIAYRAIISKEGYRSRQVRVLLPGSQYIESVSAEIKNRGFSIRFVDVM